MDINNITRLTDINLLTILKLLCIAFPSLFPNKTFADILKQHK